MYDCAICGFDPCRCETTKEDDPEIRKPPLGLVPEHIYDADVHFSRMRAILEAMHRYCEEEKEIPLKWIIEVQIRLNEYRKCATTPNEAK